jgi:hypothetical protein
MTRIVVRHLGTIAALTGFLLAVPLEAAAQQPSSDLSREEQAACRPDAIKLCFFSIPSADGLRACLRRNKPSLSSPCRALIESRGR